MRLTGKKVPEMLNRTISLVAVALVVAATALAQFELGTVVGTVRDPSALPIANAAVEIRSLATNVTRKTVTSPTGEFDFVALQPGPYALSAKQEGFKGTTETFQVAVGQRVELNVAMEVGAATQSITVSANAVTVDTASSDVTNVRTRQQVVDLPLNSRNFTQLVQLAPGVNNHGNSTNVTNGGYTAGRGTSGAVVNGNPSDIGIYLFDGIQSVDTDANVLIFYPRSMPSRNSRFRPALPPLRTAAAHRSSMSPFAQAPTIFTALSMSLCATQTLTPRITLTLAPTRFRHFA
jgi:Carboxypeptidase regulatory-like domain